MSCQVWCFAGQDIVIVLDNVPLEKQIGCERHGAGLEGQRYDCASGR